LYADPSLGQAVDRPKSAATLEQLVRAGPESLDDKEKWSILTRELT